MTFLTNFRAILFKKRGFSVNFPHKMHPCVPSGRVLKLKSDANNHKWSCNMIKVNKQCLNDISDQFQSNIIRKTWIFG